MYPIRPFSSLLKPTELCSILEKQHFFLIQVSAPNCTEESKRIIGYGRIMCKARVTCAANLTVQLQYLFFSSGNLPDVIRLVATYGKWGPLFYQFDLQICIHIVLVNIWYLQTRVLFIFHSNEILQVHWYLKLPIFP